MFTPASHFIRNVKFGGLKSWEVGFLPNIFWEIFQVAFRTILLGSNQHDLVTIEMRQRGYFFSAHSTN